MKTLFSAVKVMAMLGALVSGQALATPIDIEWNGTAYQGDGSAPTHLEGISGVETFEFDGDISGNAIVDLFYDESDSSVSDTGDYGFGTSWEGLFPQQHGDWYLEVDFSTLASGSIWLELKSSWFAFDFISGDTSLLIDENLFSMDITEVNLLAGDGDDFLYSGDVANLNLALDPFGFAGKKVTFELFQAASNDGGSSVYEGNALLSFNVTEVPEPSTIALFSFVLLLLNRVRMNRK
ncbi:PEP-CTERM sorting domain-containing protein [Catenovulum sp. SX2]|uniref:PEP-CTERM sorting domain-containing protein n=1 Tax=Catenovulum sp. SX2 TaxID=3398614 RepID=UPI003F86F425